MDGSILLNIPSSDGFSELKSSSVQIASLSWLLEAKLECSESINYLSINVICNPESESNLWTCYANVQFQLVSQKTDKPNFIRELATHKFTLLTNSKGIPLFMKWDEIWAEDSEYKSESGVLVDAHITVQKTVGISIKPSFDFTVPQQYISDGILVIGDTRLHINKGYLSVFSPVFGAMFFSQFVEREQEEIVIQDVVLEEFVEMLNVIYPTYKPISNANVEYLLELGNKFGIQYVMDKCESHLIESDEIEMIKKLIWADQYCLTKLQDACIRKFQNAQEIKALSTSDKYEMLGDTTKLALLNKLFKFV